MTELPLYGSSDATYAAVGGEPGIRQLVDDFYDIMSTDSRFERIWSWHPANGEMSRDKLTRFLCGWMGGPNIYKERYGAISIPGVHGHLKVTHVERDMWLDCMAEALAKRDYDEPLREYLLKQLSFPAERVRQVCEANLDDTDGIS